MSTTAGSVVIDLLLRTGSLETDSARAQKNLKKFKASADDISSSFVAMGKSIVGAFALNSLVDGFRNVVNGMDDINDAAERVGVSVESLSGLQYVAKLNALEANELEGALNRVNVAVANMANGVDGKGGAELQALLKGYATDGKAADEVLLEVADRLSKFSSSTQKAAFANKIFGNELGSRMIPFLNQGREGIERLLTSAKQMGLVLGDDAAKAAGKFNDQMDIMSVRVTGAARSIVTNMLPAMDSLTEKLAAASNSSLMAGFISSITGSDKNPGARFMELNKELEGLIKQRDELAKMPAYKKNLASIVSFGNDEVQVDQQITAIEKELTYIKQLQNARANAALDAEAQRAKSKPKGTDPGLPTNKKADVDEGQRYIDQLQKTLAMVDAQTEAEKVLADVASGSIKFRTEGQKELALFIANTTDAQRSAVEARKEDQKALDDLVDSLIKQDEENRDRLDRLTGRDTAKQMQSDVDLLSAAWQNGTISVEEYDRAIKNIQFGTQELAAQTDEFAKQAARSIQTTLGDNLYQIMDGNFKNIGSSFADMLKHMAANALAANLAKSLFGGGAGEIGAGGSNLGGLIGTGLTFLGSLFGGGKASGGPVDAGTFYEVNEHGPELFESRGRTYLMSGADGGFVRPLTSGLPAPGGSGMAMPKITINNLGTPQNYEAQSISRGEIVMIARDQVHKHAANVVANDLARPNSATSKSLSQNTDVSRKR